MITQQETCVNDNLWTNYCWKLKSLVSTETSVTCRSDQKSSCTEDKRCGWQKEVGAWRLQCNDRMEDLSWEKCITKTKKYPLFCYVMLFCYFMFLPNKTEINHSKIKLTIVCLFSCTCILNCFHFKLASSLVQIGLKMILDHWTSILAEAVLFWYPWP